MSFFLLLSHFDSVNIVLRYDTERRLMRGKNKKKSKTLQINCFNLFATKQKHEEDLNMFVHLF